jgi:hypothetical protein
MRTFSDPAAANVCVIDFGSEKTLPYARRRSAQQAAAVSKPGESGERTDVESDPTPYS